jgi:hypothetical protein
MQVEKPCSFVSYCFFMYLQLGKSLPSSYLATKLENLAAKFELGSCYGPRAKLVESIPSQKNLAEN